MLIYYSMIAWIALIGVIHLFMRQQLSISRIRTKKFIVSDWCIVAVSGYLVFWVALRSRFVDTVAYINSFNSASTSLFDLPKVISTSDKMPGFSAFQVIVKSIISSNYHVFFLIIALIQIVPIMLTLRKYSENFFFSVYLFITGLSFFWMMNGIRQFIPVAVLFGCTPWIIKQKWIPYVIIVLILSTFHYTALMMIPVYWIVTCKPWSKKMVFSIIMFILIAVFSERFTSILEAGLTGTVYAGATGQFAFDDGVNPLRVIVFMVPVVLSLICRKGLETDDNPMINLCINMSAVSAGLYLVGMVTSGILIGRLPIYCSMYNLILYPFIFNHYFTPSSKRLMYIMCAVGFFVYFYLLTRGYYYQSDILGYWG